MQTLDDTTSPKTRPTLVTDRLRLRPSTLDDLERITEILSKREIPDTAMYIPHPFEASVAEEWISEHAQNFIDGKAVNLYIDERESGLLIGGLNIDLDRENNHAELGYYIDPEKWGRGYATEAVKAGCSYCFEQLELERVFAWCLFRNEASKKVLEKAGFRPEGILRQHVLKWDKLEDVQYFGLLKKEYHKSV